jgi:hypothetical protein
VPKAVPLLHPAAMAGPAAKAIDKAARPQNVENVFIVRSLGFSGKF